MNLGQLWKELEDSITPEQHHGRRRIYAGSSADLNITLTQPGPRRGLALTVEDDGLRGVAELPASRGLEHIRRAAGEPDHSTLEIRLTDPSANDLFVGLADDVARATAAADDERDAVGVWLSRIRSWQRLMARAPRGLSPERQRGLYAELAVLRNDLVGRVGIETAVDGWQGPIGGHDFQLKGGAYEVKGSASNEPQVVTVNSERQLDETGTDGLHLVHLSLDVHRYSGESLPEIVDQIRKLVALTAVEALFGERLVDAGYADAHEPHYSATGYTIREQHFFRVEEGFPRIVEGDLPGGIGGVRYQLVVAACAGFATSAADALSGIGQGR